MLALAIRYICDWAAATSVSDRDAPEWPPHPDRIFMALAAAHFETDRHAAERSALEWIADVLPPPSIAASLAERRTSVTTYVPVNDSQAPRLAAHKTPTPGQILAGR